MYINYLLIFKQLMTLCGERKYGVKCIHYIFQKLVKIFRILNNEIYPKITIRKHLPSEFKVNRGLRQGEAIVPLPYDVVLETSIRRFKVETQGNIFDKCSHYGIW